MNRPIVVFLSGLAGSGKSHVCEIIKARFEHMFQFSHHEYAKSKGLDLRAYIDKATDGWKPSIRHFILIENPYDLNYKADVDFMNRCEVLHLFLDVDYQTWLFNLHVNNHYKLDRFKKWCSLEDADVEKLYTEEKFNGLKKYQRDIVGNNVDEVVTTLDEVVQRVEKLIVESTKKYIAEFKTTPTVFNYQGFDFGNGLSHKGASKTDAKWKMLFLDRVDFKNKSVLDIGCNIGAWSYKVAQAGASRVVGLEMDEHNYEAANFLKDTFYRNAPIEYVRNYFMDYKCGEAFDYVFAIAVLHHMANFETLDEVVIRMSRLCKYMCVIEVADKVRDVRMTQEYIYASLKKHFKYAHWMGYSIGHSFSSGDARHIFHCYNRIATPESV